MMKTRYKLYKGAWVFDGPPHEELRLSAVEMKRMLKRGGYLVRNCYDFDCEQETSFWYVIKDSFGGMEELSSKCRNQVRRAKKTYVYRRIGAEELKLFGYDVYVNAASSYRVKTEILSYDVFSARLKDTDEYDYWAGFERETGKMVIWSINHVMEESVDFETIKIDPAYLGHTYPMYGLMYEMNCYYIETLHKHYVQDGARSITEHSNIQPFLIEKFNFRKAHCQLRIEYIWWLKLLVKLLYPFRRWMFVRKIKSILLMESMSRNEY